ncbi:MAG: hypothetical protein Q9209_004792 [Squamulea sp. 1 TL-2023]
MAKRSADTERLGDENEFGSSAPSMEFQNQRATAAQLAARKIARPRGGRRPPTQARPLGASASPLSQSQSFPAPSWGANNSIATAGTQQPPNGFSFGQSSGPFSQSMNSTEPSDNQMSSPSSSFPPFGGFNSNFGQQTNTPSSTGFNFAAPTTINNPFANLNQNPVSQTTANGVSGNIFNTPTRKPATLQEQQQAQASEQEKLSASERKTPSHWLAALPPDAQETDPQSFFVPHAPFKWGQPDPPKQDQPQQAASESNSTDVSQQNSQTSMNLFGKNEQPRKDTTDMFAHLQQPSSSALNPFAQPAGQQPQTSNIFGQQNASPFQSQASQTLSNPFAKSSTEQDQTSSNLFNKPATSPTKDGDSMSTTPDTSPQSNNDRDRYGAFVSVTAAPKPPFMNGSTPSASGSNLFNFPSNPPTDQSFTSNAFGTISNQTNVDVGSQDSDNVPSDISLGSPKKNQSTTLGKSRKVAQPTVGRPHMEEKPIAKNSFAGFTLTPSNSTSSTPSLAANGVDHPAQDQSNLGYGTPANSTATVSGTAHTESIEVQQSPESRQPGVPPTPPADFTEGQKRQFITGWRLKSLDRGLQSYLEYSSYTEQEIDSISTYYNLRKQAILDADGGPVKDVNNKRPAEHDERQAGSPNKKARRQAPSATVKQNSQALRTTSANKGNASKRKAAEELNKSNGQTQSESAKRSKPEDQITYPSLPSSSSSQTAKMFGHLAGKKSNERPLSNSDASPSGNLANGITQSNTVSTPAGSSQSSLFFQAPESSSQDSNKQSPLFNFPAGSASLPQEPKSGNPDASGQPSSIQSGSPFKGLFPSSSGQKPSDSFSSTSSNLFASQPSNSSSIFANRNGDNAQKSSAKRKANIFNASEDPGEEAGPVHSEEQQAKKQRVEEVSKATTGSDNENDHTSRSQSTTERTGFGESIFARPGMLPSSTSNMFSHLGGLANEQEDDDADDDEADDDDGPGRTKRGTKQSASASVNGTSSFSKSNASGSTVFNPFAGKSFDTLKKPAAEGETAGRSFFDRIERDPKGQPIKAPVDLKDVDFGQSILKTPKVGGPLDRANQAPNSSISSTISSAPGENTTSNTGAKSMSTTPPTNSAFNLFGKPSSLTAAPMANMTGSKEAGDSPGSDHTWKAGTPVKFSEISGAPSINFTSPSPSKTPLSGLFGAPKPSPTSETPASFMFKPLDSSSTKPAPLTFGISAPPKDSLAPPSETQSESTSRATSPGAGESGNEASDQVHEEESHPDLDTTEASRAEADEDTIFEVKAKAHKHKESKHFNATTGKDEITRNWALQGFEQFRILKHRDTKKTRMLMKLKVNGRVILNAGLQKSLNYVLATSKTVRVPVPTESKVESWTIQVGKEADAKELVRLLEENKAN